MSQLRYVPRFIGDFGDGFESTLKTGNNNYNKVQAVKHSDADGIFVPDVIDPDIIYLRIYKDGNAFKTSQAIHLTTTKTEYSFYEDQCPDETDWDFDKFQVAQIAVLNAYQEVIQSYKCAVPDPLEVPTVLSAGIAVSAYFNSGQELGIVDKVELVANV